MYDRSLGDDDGGGISQTITVGPEVKVIWDKSYGTERIHVKYVYYCKNRTNS